jgi:hypothetical protein
MKTVGKGNRPGSYQAGSSLHRSEGGQSRIPLLVLPIGMIRSTYLKGLNHSLRQIYSALALNELFPILKAAVSWIC